MNRINFRCNIEYKNILMALLTETGHVNKSSGTVHKHGITNFTQNLLDDAAIYVESLEKPSRRSNNKSNFKQLLELSKGRTVIRTDKSTGAKISVDLYAIAQQIPAMHAALSVLKEEATEEVITSMLLHSSVINDLRSRLEEAKKFRPLNSSITIRVSEAAHQELIRELAVQNLYLSKELQQGKRDILTSKICNATIRRVTKTQHNAIAEKLKTISDYMNNSLIGIHEQKRIGTDPITSVAILLHKLKGMYETELKKQKTEANNVNR